MLTPEELGLLADMVYFNGKRCGVPMTHMLMTGYEIDVIGVQVRLEHTLSTAPCEFRIAGHKWEVRFYAAQVQASFQTVMEHPLGLKMFNRLWKLDEDQPCPKVEGDFDAFTTDLLMLRMADYDRT